MFAWLQLPVLLLWIIVLGSRPLVAQAVVEQMTPASIEPGKSTQVILQGKNLTGPVRYWTQAPVEHSIDSSDENRVALTFRASPQAPLGLFYGWIASKQGVSEALPCVIDDLPTTLEKEDNHGFATAQAISIPMAIEGRSNGAASDLFRIEVEQGQTIAFDVLAFRIGSKMDPLLRLLDANGREIEVTDDRATNGDAALQYTFATQGTYFLEVRDNRYLQGDRYRLRVGSFPLIDFVWPLYANPGQSIALTSYGAMNSVGNSVERSLPDQLPEGPYAVALRAKDGSPSSWGTIKITHRPLRSVEHATSDHPIDSNIPCILQGRLNSETAKDRYSLMGKKGASLVFASKTRSLGTATLLHMKLIGADQKVVAESPVGEQDEFQLTATLPADGVYQLEVRDLLRRRGDAMAYAIEVAPPSPFAVALKPDAKTKDRFLLETQQGVGGIDLVVQRQGYDGEIDIDFASPVPGLRWLRSTIPAKAKEGRVYMAVDASFQESALQAIPLIARSKEQPSLQVFVSGQALRTLRNPQEWMVHPSLDGRIAIAGHPNEGPFFQWDASPLPMARRAATQTATLKLVRSKPEFKDAVTLLQLEGSTPWSFQSKIDKDQYVLTITPPASASQSASVYPDTLMVRTIGEFQGRGRIEEQRLPLEWFDPLELQVKAPLEVAAGQTIPIQFSVRKNRLDVGKLTLRLKNLPEGVTVPEAWTLEEAEMQKVVDLNLPQGIAKSVASMTLQAEVTGSYAGQPYTATSVATVKVASAPSRIEAYPTSIALTGQRVSQQLVVTGADEKEQLRDWTHLATIRVEDPKIARVEHGVIQPLSNGQTQVTIAVGHHRLQVPLTVERFEQVAPIAFENEVLVALSKQNCNSGACHGSPSGKGSFRLSLRAFDPKLDQLTLIREDMGRRVHVLDAEKSLLLLKPLMKVPHGGGVQLHKSDLAYQLLRSWIAEGAQADAPDARRCVRLEITPHERRVLELKTGQQQIAVTAHFSDGSKTDVTPLAAYESSHPSIASVNAQGLVQSHQRGEATILIRYLEHVEALPLLFVDQVQGFVWSPPASRNYIDDLVFAKLHQLQYAPAALCDDSEFLRRIYLDLLGILPTPEEAQQFVADTSKEKRAKLIDALLDRPEHAKFWALKWCDLLKVTAKTVGDDGVHKYHRWVEHAIRTNVPYDVFARELITASGSTLSNPPANFYRTAGDTNECVENVSQVFLGARLQCAKCHNHPFERWTQDNYYGLASFFNRVQRKKSVRPGEQIIWASGSGEVTQPRTGTVMKPWLPKQGSVDLSGEEDRRLTFAEWLIQKENPYFAKIEVNRIWSHLFSRGIVDPIDDFRDSNPPTNVPLLDALTRDFVEHGYDRKALLKTILNSHTYQASFKTSEWNRDDHLYFSHQEPRMLTAEQLLDALNHVFDLPQSFGNLPIVHATQLPAPDIAKNDFLRVFGQPERSTVCACERNEDSNLGMAIELFNGPVVYEKLKHENNRFRKGLKSNQPIEQIINELYWAALARGPSDAEYQTAVGYVRSQADTARGLEDFCWALINTDEFLFQH